MTEKGGLAKKLLALDLLQRIALYPPTHRVLVASGVIEALLAQPKGIIPLALPKLTPKGWKAGKNVTGLEAQGAKLLGILSRMDDSTRVRVNLAGNDGVNLLVRMVQRKGEPAGALNDITPQVYAYIYIHTYIRTYIHTCIHICMYIPGCSVGS